MNNKEYSFIEFIDNDFKLDVRVDDNGMVWLSQKEIAKLYGTTDANINIHIRKIMSEEELYDGTIKDYLTVQKEGNREVKRNIKIYNLEIILLIGYKVNSKRTSIFKKWYEEIIKWDKSNNNLVKNELQIVKFIDSGLSIDVSVDPSKDTVWLTIAQIAVLFERERSVISKHISNIYIEGELNKETTCAKNAHMVYAYNRGYESELYNLDVIISVGYRVKSKRGTMFRIWANNILKNYLIKGYSINEARCLECASGYRMLSMAYRELESKYERIENRIFGEDVEIVNENDIPHGIIAMDRILTQAKNKIIIIDKYADLFLLKILDKYQINITIITSKNYLDNLSLKSNIKILKHNNLHSRYILIDDDKTYTITHSFNGIGLNAFEIIYLKEIKPKIILNEIGVN